MSNTTTKPTTLSRGRRLLLAAAVLAAGIGATQFSAAPEAAAADPKLSDISCDGPIRFFQLRAGDATTGYQELWVSSTSNPTKAGASFYDWRKIYTFDVKVKSIAAHEQTKESVYLYASNVDNRLVEYRFAVDQSDITGAKTLTQAGADYGFSSLTSDGRRLYGINGGKINVMPLPDNWSAPSGRAEVSGLTAWPNAFFGVSDHAGDYELAYTSDNGNLRYVDVDYANGQWTSTGKTVRSEGWANHTISSPGGGLLVRFGLADDTLNSQLAGNPDGGLNTSITDRLVLERSTTAKDNPVTTAPNVCAVSQQAPPPTGGPLVTEAQKYLGRDGGQCKAFITFLVNRVYNVFVGGGYHQPYLNGGFHKVSKSEARAGDIIQIINRFDPENFYSGMHTAILMEGFGSDNSAKVIDSNFVSHETVGTHSWNPFARQTDSLIVEIWRKG